jgi:hypothetical protein
MEDLNNEDISLLCNYRRDKLEEIEEQSRALDLKIEKHLIQTLTSSTGASEEFIVQGGSGLAVLIRERRSMESAGGFFAPSKRRS